MRIVIFLFALVALLLGAVMLFAAPGSGLGLWEYGSAFEIYGMLATPTLIAAGLALLGAVVAFVTGRTNLGLFALLAAAAAGGGGYIPVKMRALVAENPFIHDVTTDFENPPQILAAADLPRKNPPAYVGDETIRDTNKTVAEAQREAFPDLTPLILNEAVEAATAKARDAIDAMGMDVLAEGPAGGETGDGWRIEAVYRTRFFGFKDDFIVRLTPAEGGGTKVDVRSKSRVGGSDLGANARRVRTFMARMKDG